MNLLVIVAALIAALMSYGLVKLKQAHNEIERMTKANADLSAQNKTLNAQKTTAETQVKNAKVRQKNEENTLSVTRGKLIDGLQQSGDLRD